MPDGLRKNVGIKYYRVTGERSTEGALPCRWARDKAASHAGNFLGHRQAQVMRRQRG